MRSGSRRWFTYAALVLGALMMACETESPTAPPIPPPGGGGPPTGNQQVEIAVAVSNPSPLVNSTSTITATVTQGGQPVPAGTAVEFATDVASATFVENNSNAILRITNNGVASATVTSATAGRVNIIVRVGAVTRTVSVNFLAEPIDPTPPPTGPTITNISPTKGSPQGWELVTITGTNFQQPVRVLFGDVPGNVIDVTSTRIRVITPPVQLDVGGGEQRREVTVRVINQAGTADERAVDAAQRFAFELAILTPFVFNISPDSGPNEGNTRVTIFGSGFQPPTKVFFGTGGGPGPLSDQVEVEVLQVFFDRIIANTPPALGMGAPLRDQQVTVRVLNVASNLSGSLGSAFRYGPSMQITSVTPLSGSALGGTRVTIAGWGFDDPVTVTVAGVSAQPIEVSGTKIVVVTGALLNPCVSEEGNVVVHNVEDDASDTWGDEADEEGFDLIGTFPTIIGVSPNPALPGQPVTITVRNAGAGTIRFQIGNNTLLPTPPSATNPIGDSQFTVTLPTNFTFTSEPCVDAAGRQGQRFIPVLVNVTFQNITTGCEDTLANGLTVNPTDLSCRVPPNASVNPPALAFTGTCGGPSNPQTITVTNTGGTPLTVNGITGPSLQVIAGPPFPTTLADGASATWTVQINPLPAPVGTPPAAPPTQSITVTVSTNDPDGPTQIPATVNCTP